MTALVGLIVAGVLLQAEGDVRREVPRREFRPRRVVPALRAIVHPPAIPAGRVTDQVSENELVLGVVVEGQARAYPINMLTGPSREIINDTLGKRPIAATW